MAGALAVLLLAIGCGGNVEDIGDGRNGLAGAAATSKASGDDRSTPPAETGPPFGWVSSCSPAPATAFVPDETLSDLSVAKGAMSGRWRGTNSNPWTAPYEVAFEFHADGHYASRALEPAIMIGGGPEPVSSPALYYGTDDATPLKQWRLEDVLANGTVTGEIDVAFAYDPGQYRTAGWQGLIDDLAFDAARERMRFEMNTSDGHGPVAFDLRRCP